MSYYKEIDKMRMLLDKTLLEARLNKTEIYLPSLLYEITKKCLVSEKAIIKRLELIKDAKNEFFVEKGVIKWR